MSKKKPLRWRDLGRDQGVDVKKYFLREKLGNILRKIAFTKNAETAKHHEFKLRIELPEHTLELDVPKDALRLQSMLHLLESPKVFRLNGEESALDVCHHLYDELIAFLETAKVQPVRFHYEREFELVAA